MDLSKYLNANDRGAAAEIAKKIGVSPVMISMIKLGRRKCPVQLAKKIEKATNGKVSREDLLPHVFQD